ncbi:MAG: multiheme c-type cytochrome [Planctomycetota bacterium]|jgi:hypothetical protein
MKISGQAMIVAVLVAALVAVVFFDPRTDRYLSKYSPRATDYEVAAWMADFKDWKHAPTWDRFNELLDAKPFDPLGPPDFEGHYVFGKYNYDVLIQIRGNHLLYASWGNDDQTAGGAWTAVGEGYHMHGRKWRTTWSCLDLSRAASNGGGAWFTFSSDRKSIFVKYYHDTEPFSNRDTDISYAIEEGEAVLKSSWDGEKLEGRVRPGVPTIKERVDLWGRVIVKDGEGIAGATVRLRKPYGEIKTNGDPRHDTRINGDILDVTTRSDSKGFFKVTLEEIQSLTIVSAAKHKFFNGYVAFDQQMALSAIGEFSKRSIAMATITLRRVPQVDHKNYEFVSPEYLKGENYHASKHMNCGNCHRQYWNEWKQSRHATMANNEWTKATFVTAREYALAKGQTEDECTPCHSPSLSATLETHSLTGRTLLDASGVHKFGNHCDFCHKIDHVSDLQAPGVNGSLHLLRPNPRDDTFPGPVKQVFGNVPDAWFLYMGAAYNPLYEMGTLCASCHEHTTRDGRHSQGTYSEWKASKYARPGKDYRECQSCHMPGKTGGRKVLTGTPPNQFVKKVNSIKFAREGFRKRGYYEAHHHEFFGTDAPKKDHLEFLKDGVSMETVIRKTPTAQEVFVVLENIGAGHAIPTGHGLKRYLLAVIARDKDGNVVQASNSLPAEELTGKAKDISAGVIIGRRFGGQWHQPFWKAGAELDTRLLPDQPRKFSFVIPGADTVEVKLILRRGSPTMIQSQGLDIKRGQVSGAPLDVVVHEWSSQPR